MEHLDSDELRAARPARHMVTTQFELDGLRGTLVAVFGGKHLVILERGTGSLAVDALSWL